MIDEKLIEKLLIAFYKGNTTREEENVLQKFFNTKNIPEKWSTDRILFFILYDSPEIDIPKNISERLKNKIDKYITETCDSKKKRKHTHIGT